MGSDEKVFVHAKDPSTARAIQSAGFVATEEGGWLDVLIDGHDGAAALACRLSTALSTTSVYFRVRTASGALWIRCFKDGREIRELSYRADTRWSKSGAPMAFEDTREIARWMRKHDLSAEDGYSILECFLGRRIPANKRSA